MTLEEVAESQAAFTERKVKIFFFGSHFFCAGFFFMKSSFS